MKLTKIAVLAWVSLFAMALARGEGLEPAVQAKLEGRVKEIQTWAANPALVNAVKAHNASLPATSASMSQDKWKSLTVLDPFLRGFTKNEAAAFLKSKKDEIVTEAFLSGADGLKVAFLSKPTSWSHKGSAKHDVPLSGKNWQGTVEVDQSSGLQQLQVSVPVLDGDKPIGSLVVGLSVAKLSK